jgi:hypothetical protein
MIATAGIAVAFAIAGCTASNTSIAPIPQSAGQPSNVKRMDPPTPTPTPIQLVIAGLVGTPNWPNGDTATGGQGQHIAGLNCLQQLGVPFHHHAHLALFVNGQQLAFPMGVGMYLPNKGKKGYIYHQNCLYFLHTHDRTGILHMESKTDLTFTLGTLFTLWGEPLSTTQIAEFTGPVTVYVDGTLDTTDALADVPLTPGSDVTLVIGQAPDWIPVYILPPSLLP